ncbi:MAG: BadF/BadG/BcrA/BcrD ATPase family protein [Geminicoccaceae bacterium]
MNDDPEFLLGIDGGGTHCRARLCSVDGQLLGEGRSGAANVRLGLEAALGEVLDATGEALVAAGLDDQALEKTHAGLGLAGVNLPLSFQEADAYPLPFARKTLATDTEIARLGAHQGGDGGIVIAGTGSCAEGRMGPRSICLGGWGFALSDEGSGATIGRAALRHGLLAHDGLTASGALAKAVLAAFDDEPEAMVRWSERAKPRDYAAFASKVLQHVDQGDPAAIEIIQDAAAGIDKLILGLTAAGIAPIALLGGLADALRPWLCEEAAAELIEPAGTALDGAILLARQSMREH